MRRLLRSVRLLAAIALVAGSVMGQTYYVDGQTGLDAPGNGGSPATPWRTIGYALASMPTSPYSKTIQIQGDQTYGSATNGEVFPLTLPAQVALRGVPGASGQRPRLVVPPGATGITLPASVPVPWNIVILEAIDVQGGDVGFRMGANAAVTQRVELRKCSFRQQNVASVRIRAAGGWTGLTAFECVTEVASGQNPRPAGLLFEGECKSLTLDDCRFQGGDAVAVYPWGTTANSLETADVRRCHFESTTAFAGLASPGQFSGTPATYTISDCRFVQSLGVYDVANWGQLRITMTRCSFSAASAGQFDGTMAEKSVTLTIDQCAFDSANGVYCHSPFHGGYTFIVRDSVFRGFGTAFGLSSAGELAGTYLTMERCRLIDGVTAVASFGVAESGMVNLDSCLIARCSGPAIAFSGFQGPGAPALQQFYIQQTTIADCQTGISIGIPAPSTWISGIAFDGNGTDIAAQMPVSCSGCLTNGPASAGISHVANVGLIRPQYKLAANSPCIDAGGGGFSTSDYEGDPRSLAGSPTAIPRPDIGADEYAPYGSLRTYGFPGRSPDGVRPTIATNSPSARLGVPYDVRVDHASLPNQTGTSFAFLASGLRDLAHPLPFDLGVFGMANSYLWMDPQDLGAPLAIGANGSIATTFQLPYLPQLAGLPIVHQWLVALPGGLGLVTSDALRVSFGL
jgi:hypothetical protein